MKRVFFSILTSCCIYATVSAQHLDLDFKLLDKEAALSNSNTTCITQDTSGYIWIGTTDGLNKFDGYEMKYYHSVINDSLSLPDNTIHALFTDKRGTLWIGTQNGLCKYIPEYDQFFKFDLSLLIPDFDSYQIASIEEDQDGDIFISMASQLIRYSYDLDSFSLFLTSEHGEISSFEFDENNTLWMGSLKEGGLYQIDEQGKIINRFVADKSNPKSISSSSVFDIALHNGYIWIATEGGGINRFNREKQEFKRYPLSDIYEKYARYTYVDNDNRLWIGDYTGIKLYNQKDDTFYGYYTDPENPASIPPNASSIFQDAQGNYWTLHLPGGVAISEVKKGFHLFTGNQKDYWHTTKDNIQAVEEDSQGNLWLSNPYNGIDIFHWQKAETIRFLHENNNDNSLGEGATFDMHWANEVMWIATNRGGLQYIDKDLNKFISFTNDPNDSTSIACNDIRSVTSDKEGNIWVTVHGKGVDKLDPKTGIFTHYNSQNSKLANDWTFEILINSFGEVWVATAWGLSRLRSGATKFENYFSSGTDEKSLNGNGIITVFQDKLNRLWVGTHKGLNLYNRTTDDFTRIEGPLQNKHICAILDDDRNTIWISTQDGLYSFNVTDNKFRRLDETDGLPSSEFNPRSSFKNLHNDLFFGSIKGLAIFNPDKLVYNDKPPPVLLTGFKIFNEEVNCFESPSILKEHISYADKINLDYKHNMVTFEFKAINMIQAKKNQYAYKMEGFDDDWRYIGTKKEATYTNLSPGNYIFRVKASNNDGFWNEQGTSIQVIISPPWWMTWWFRVITVLFIFGLIASVVIIRNRQLIRQKAILAEKVRQKTRELRKKNKLLNEQAEYLNETNALLTERQKEIILQSEKLQILNSTKDRFFSIIAHDLTSPFNTILGFTELFSTNLDKMSDKEKITMATAINESAQRVHGLLDNLLKWARSQTEGMKYNPKKVKIEKIITETIQLYETRLIEKDIKLKIENKADLEVTTDIEMLKTIMRNLISNAIKYTNHHGKLLISAKPNTKNAIISVSDTGIGMKPELINKLFDMKTSFSTEGTDGEKGSGIGLILTRDFIERNKGRLSVDSTVGKGTTFKFTVPLA